MNHKPSRKFLLMLLLLSLAVGWAWSVRAQAERYTTLPEITESVHDWLPDAIAAREARRDIIEKIWGQRELPVEDLAKPVEAAAADPDLQHVAMAIRYRVDLGHGFASFPLLLHPPEWNGDLVVYHGGHHGAGWRAEAAEVQRFLRKGFSVLAVSMPGTGDSVQPEQLMTPEGPMPLRRWSTADHNAYAWLELEGMEPLQLFLTPVLQAVNRVVSEKNPRSIYMVGLSGGGWTTHIYAALDPRIRGSFPVAGNLPFFLGPASAAAGDYEQKRIPMLGYGYLAYYALAALEQDRYQVQFINQFDPCCFYGIGAQLYEPHVEAAVARLGNPGGWRLVILPVDRHGISDEAMNTILDEIRDKR